MDCTLAFIQPYAGNTLKSGSLHPMLPLGSFEDPQDLLGEVSFNDPILPAPRYGLEGMDADHFMEYLAHPGQLWFVAHCCFDCVTEDFEANAQGVAGGVPDVEFHSWDGPLVCEEKWDALPYTEVPHDVLPAVSQWFGMTMSYDTDDSRTVWLLRQLDEHTMRRFLR